MKKILKLTLTLALVLSLLISSAYSTYAQVLFEQRTVTPVFTGLNYEQVRRVTAGGLLDVHVLTVDLTQRHLGLQPVSSQTENGLKEHLTRLLEANGAVAGVNGDFFGLAGTHSVALGLEMQNGRITNANDFFNNHEDPKSATFFINGDGVPFITYLTTELKFFHDGRESVKLNTYNVSSEWTGFFDRSSFITTADFDARFPNRHKIVVDNDVITYISRKGETVTVPENGYIIILSESAANYYLYRFAAGQRAEVRANSSAIDLNRMEMAISGAGKIISNGHFVEDGMFITGRHPRTAIGMTECRTRIIMMVVDGRSHSIGASHREMAALLQEFGAFNAMHLDGGGSSTMAVAESLRPMTVRNTLSDGSQRRIINGLGVFNNSTPSAPVSLAIELDDYLFAGVPSRLSVFASDRYLNKTALHSGDFTVDAGDGGYYSDGYFFPTRTGHITLVITAGSMTAAKTLTSGRLAQINAPDTVRIAHGGEHRIRLTGICADGFTGAISGRGVNIEVFPPGLVSRPEPETLIGASTGAGYIKYTAGGVERYSLLIVGTRDVTLENFAPGGREIRYIAVPAENAGHVRYISTPGGPRLELAYQMAAAATTQAAYASFPQPIEIAGQPLSLRLRVYGDNSNNWLRGRIADADGEFHIIDFARHIDWEGARTVEARLPANIATPVTLDRIYVAALENTETETRQLWFDSLTAVYSIDAGHVAVPDSMVFADRKMTELGAEQRAFTDIMLIGDLVPADAPPNYGSIQDNSKAEFNTIHGETFGIFFGETDNIGARMPVFRKASGTYSAYRLGGADVISLTAANGSMFSSNAEQWQNIRRHLASAGRNVLVLFDKNPLTSMPAKELELLQRQFVNSGRNIIVVSSEGTRTTTTVTDGVRYVNLGSLFLEDGSVNGEFKTLRVRFFEDDLRYSLK